MNKILLQQYVDNSGNCVNLGRFLKSRDPNTYQWILDQTTWLIDVKFNERIYCILNDITSQKLNALGEPAVFENLFRGYILKEYTKYHQIKKEQQLREQLLKPKYTPLIKIQKTAKRSQRRNPELYEPTAIKNIDYVECPISGIRMYMITNKHITNNLEMSVEEFNHLYPDIVRTSEAHRTAIKNGVKTIDPITGLTKYQLSQIKAKETLSKIGLDGLTGYDRKGQKTRATHMSKIDEFGRNGYHRQVDYRLNTITENGLTIEQNAHIKQRNKLLEKGITRVVGASKLSKRVLAPIVEYLNQRKIKYYFDKTEYLIKDDETDLIYFYDLTIPDYEMVIEYQSAVWHANPTLTEQEWKSWHPPKGQRKTADEVLRYDYNKARMIYKLRGFRTYYVWQQTQNEDVKNLLCLLKIPNMKY